MRFAQLFAFSSFLLSFEQHENVIATLIYVMVTTISCCQALETRLLCNQQIRRAMMSYNPDSNHFLECIRAPAVYLVEALLVVFMANVVNTTIFERWDLPGVWKTEKETEWQV